MVMLLPQYANQYLLSSVSAAAEAAAQGPGSQQGGTSSLNFAITKLCCLPSSAPLQRRKRQLKAREAGKVEAAHVSAGGAVLGLIAGVGEAAAMTKVRL